MGGLFGGGKQPQAQKQQPAGALQIQTSVYGQAKPLVYGKNRVPINLVHYFNFRPIPHTTKQKTGGKGGGKSQSSTTYTYQTAFAAGFAVGGSTIGVGTVWKNKEKHTLASLGLTLFNGNTGQTAWASLPGGQQIPYANLAFIAAPAFDLGDSPSLPNLNLEAKGLVPYNAGTIDDALPSDIITDYLTNARHGAGFGANLANLDTGANSFRKYCLARGLFISPVENNQRQAGAFLKEIADITNSAIVWREGKLNFIPYGDATITGNGATYTPNLTPLYDLTVDDFLFERNQPPVKHKEKAPEQQYNHHRIEYSARSNDYNPLIVELKDQADIDDNGLRTKAVTTYKAITLDSVARDVLQIQQQRDLHVKNTYSFRLGIRHSLLEPMDLVTLTEPGLGLDRQLVRIVEVIEQDDSIDVVAEEMNIGVANSPLFNTQTIGGYNQDFNVTAGNVTDPLIMNAPGLLTTSGYEQWIAVTSANVNWGGCVVWVSDDDLEYRRVGEVMGGARYGSVSTATFPAGSANLDTTSVLRVQLYADQIMPGTQLDCDEFRTLLYVGGEWMSYRDAVLVSGTTYDLDYFRRGAYGSTRASHAIGQAVAVIDEAIFRMPYDKGNIGKTVYFKFQSFNVFGGGLQDISTCTPYTHTLGASELTAPMEYIPISGSGVNVLLGKYTWFLDNVPPTPLTKSPGAMSVTTVADAVAFGGYYLRAVTNNTTVSDNFIYFGASSSDRNTPITPGDYVFSFYGKASVAGHQVRGRVYFDIGAQVDTPYFALTTTRARYSAKITVPSTASLAELLMFMNSSGVVGRNVDIDGIMLEPLIGTLVNPSAWIPGAASRDAIEAIAAAAAAQDTADGKIETYFQTTMPVGASIGDLWFDTDDGNKVYRHNGTTFVVAADDDMAQAIAAAAGAQATADGRVSTFYTSSTPTANAVGDLWYNTTSKIFSRWNGSAWIQVADITADKIGGNGSNILWEEYSQLQMAQAVLSDPLRSIPICNSANLTTLETVANGSAQGGFEYHAVTGGTSASGDYFRLAESATDNNITIEASKKYLVSYYARSTTAGHQMRPWVRGGKVLDGTIVSLTTTRTRYSWVVDMAGATGTGVQFGFFCNTSAVAGRHVYIDGVMVEPMVGNDTVPSTFVPGPSARQIWRSLINANNLSNGRNLVLNPNITSNMIGAATGSFAAGDNLCDNWYAGLISPNFTHQVTDGGRATGGKELVIYLGNAGTAIANGATARSVYQTKRTWPVVEGEKYNASAWIKADFNHTPTAGVTMTLYLRCAFYDAAGVFISYGQLSVPRAGGFVKYSIPTMTVPAGAAAMDIRIDFNVVNASGSSYQCPGGVFDWIVQATEFEVYKVTNMDDDIENGTNYGRVSNLDLFDDAGFRRIGLRRGNSGHRLGNQRNAVRSLTSAYGMIRTTTALSATSAGAVSVNAHTARYGGYSVAYNAVANAVTGLTVGTSYVIYCTDADLSGGTKTYFAGTNPDTVMNISDDIYVVGQITIPSSGSSSGGGGGGGTDPGDWCVDYDTYLPDGRLVRDLQPGDLVPCIDVTQEPYTIEMHPLISMDFGYEECWEMRTEDLSGCIIQSKSTPMDLPDGRTNIKTTEMFGEEVIRNVNGNLSKQTVVELWCVGTRKVCKPNLGNRMFLAGVTPESTIATHNAIYKP